MAFSRLNILVILLEFLLIYSQAQDNNPVYDSSVDYGSGSGDIQSCPMDDNCADLPARCISCDFDTSCVYGQPSIANCTVYEEIMCEVY